MNATTSADLYAASRARLTEAGLSFSPETLAGRVPACPDWTVHNLLSHLAGVAADFVSGNLDGVPRPPWTAVQVDARRSTPISGVLDEWATTGPTLEKLILSGETSHPLICNPYVDAGTHEADLHGATGIGRPPRELWLATLDWIFPVTEPNEDAPGLLSVVTPDGTYQVGAGEPVAEVRTDSYELFRAAFGRRSPAQLRAWQWSSADAADSWSTGLAFLPQTQVDLID
ncbi:maleylpyruvate isomerase N-terminal domain-containing protein [Kribbella sp. NPDC056861]|uniref:maleylpyruvate isomerase N-terminal domain-containing protein n=1 Tax=Kribbella sp. NPDC056861 TaxID=3154857 RepID=UPI00341A2A93